MLLSKKKSPEKSPSLQLRSPPRNDGKVALSQQLFAELKKSKNQKIRDKRKKSRRPAEILPPRAGKSPTSQEKPPPTQGRSLPSEEKVTGSETFSVKPERVGAEPKIWIHVSCAHVFLVSNNAFTDNTSAMGCGCVEKSSCH